MRNQLGHSRRTRREVNKHPIGVIGFYSVKCLRRGVHEFTMVMKIRRGFLRRVIIIDNGAACQRRTVRFCFADSGKNMFVVGCADELYRRGVAAVYNILGCKLEGRGDSDGAQLAKRDDGKPRLRALLEHHHDLVAPPDSERRKHVGGLVRQAFQLTEGEAAYMVGVAIPHQRRLIGHRGGVCVDNIITEVEIIRNV